MLESFCNKISHYTTSTQERVFNSIKYWVLKKHHSVLLDLVEYLYLPHLNFLNTSGLVGVFVLIKTCFSTSNAVTNVTVKTSSDILQYSKEELEFRLTEVPKWFQTFYHNTNEKVILQQTFAELINSISLKSMPSLDTCSLVNDSKSSTPDNYIENLHTVVDLGCCSGDLHLRIADSLAHELSTQNITNKVDFLGIDQDSFRLIETGKAMVKKGYANIMHMFFKADLFKNDFFQSCYIISELKKYAMDSADFIISSHIAYYAPNITKFVESILNFRSKNGFALFIHESEYSIGKVLPLDYNVPINSLTDTQIAETLIKFGAKVYYKTLYSTIELLLGINEFINDWKADLCNYSACIDAPRIYFSNTIQCVERKRIFGSLV